MSSVPKIRFERTPILIGKDGNTTIYDVKYNALLASQGNHKLRNGSWSGGGDFYTTKIESLNSGSYDYSWTYLGSPYNGTACGVVGVPSAPNTVAAAQSRQPSVSSARLSSYGDYATGYARTRPGNPTANLGQFIIELRDLPTLPGKSLLKGLPFNRVGREAHERVKWFKSLGSEYLNVVFGWKPFVKDLQEIYSLMKNIDKQIAQIKRDNNRVIHRRGTVRNTSSTSQGASTTNTYPFANVLGAPPNITGGTTSYSVTTTVEEKSWFSAAYIYYIADVNDWKWDARARAALFGVLPTPSLLYEVMPWSWMIDWFINMGDVMSNASMNAVDNLLALYSYVMIYKRTTTMAVAQTSWSSKQAGLGTQFYTDVEGGSATFSSKYEETSKARFRGSPYGIGVSYSGLSSGQKATVAALGLSRSNF